MIQKFINCKSHEKQPYTLIKKASFIKVNVFHNNKLVFKTHFMPKILNIHEFFSIKQY